MASTSPTSIFASSNDKIPSRSNDLSQRISMNLIRKNTPTGYQSIYNQNASLSNQISSRLDQRSSLQRSSGQPLASHNATNTSTSNLAARVHAKNLTVDTNTDSSVTQLSQQNQNEKYIPATTTSKGYQYSLSNISSGSLTTKNSVLSPSSSSVLSNKSSKISEQTSTKLSTTNTSFENKKLTASTNSRLISQIQTQYPLTTTNSTSQSYSFSSTPQSNPVRMTRIPSGVDNVNKSLTGISGSEKTTYKSDLHSVLSVSSPKNSSVTNTQEAENSNSLNLGNQTVHLKDFQLPNHEPTKCSVKTNGIVKAYAANTNQGLVRNYNEDRVSIILNIMKPASRANENWPKCSFFGVYDGHGGVTCADFLRDNLHQFVIRETSFPWSPREAILKGFEAAEKAFLELAQKQPSGEIDRSGSCAIVVLIISDMCYVANVGDSRAVMSGSAGSRVFTLSRDHKPIDEIEQKRIIENGGKIYQSQAPTVKSTDGGKTQQTQILLGPHRVFPGRLSVSRTFGDIEAKLTKFGGNPNVLISTPDIKSFKIADDYDFIVLACDGIFDKLTSKETIRAVWDDIEQNTKSASDIHQQCGLGVESILKEAVLRKTLDNITVVLVAFKNFKDKLFGESKEDSENVLNSDRNLKATLKDQAHERRDRIRTQPNTDSPSTSMSDISNISSRDVLERSTKYVPKSITTNTTQQTTTFIDRRALLKKTENNSDSQLSSTISGLNHSQRAIPKRLISSSENRNDSEDSFRTTSMRVGSTQSRVERGLSNILQSSFNKY